jgi:hypothetical protein
MRSRSLIMVIACLVVAAPLAAWAQYGGGVHNGGWANGTGVILPPLRTAEVPEPVTLALLPQTSFAAVGTNAYLYAFLNAPLSEARARIRIIRVSDLAIVGTSGWTTASNNRAYVSGLTVGETYRVDVELEALTQAWLSVPWFTLITSYVQPSKYDPPVDWHFES